MNKNLWWLDVGIGYTLVPAKIGDYNYCGAVGLSFSIYDCKSRLLLTFRYFYNEEPHDYILLTGKFPFETLFEVSVLLGFCNKTRFANYSTSCGFAFVGGTYRGKYLYSTGGFLFASTHYYEENFFRTVELPMDLKFFFTPLSFLGIGLTGFANINPKKNYYGFHICLELGSLRF